VPNQFILTAKEIKKVQNATWVFNNFIKDMAVQHDLAFVDFNKIMKQVKATGVKFDGVTFTTKFIVGNLFSLDGIHLTPQGNAVVANYFIDAINTTYAASVPKVNVSDYPPVVLP
jgi:hypothetical protein